MMRSLVVAGVAVLASVPAAGKPPEPLIVAVAPLALTERAFEPFGQVVRIPETREPDFKNAVIKLWTGVARGRMQDGIEVNLLRVKARARELAEMERHLRSPLLLVAIREAAFLAVAPPVKGASLPRAADVRVFELPEGQGVLLDSRTWYWAPFPKKNGSEGLYLTVYRERTRDADDVVRTFRGGEVVKF